jgi:hypothetical protein
LRRDDERDWALNRGKTRTARTGPSVDHTTNTTRGRFWRKHSTKIIGEKMTRRVFNDVNSVFDMFRSFEYLKGIEGNGMQLIKINICAGIRE